ncbi:hypothetical protein QYF36_025611 [Acer negundo]|nr:hypothetical protein QYF36_025611 [Acer negundo]
MTVSTCTHALSKIHLTRFDISIARDLLAAFSPRVRPTLRSSSSRAAATTAVASAQEYHIRPAFSHILDFPLHALYGEEIGASYREEIDGMKKSRETASDEERTGFAKEEENLNPMK